MGVAHVGHFDIANERTAVLMDTIGLDDVLLAGHGLHLALAEVGANAITLQTGQHPAIDDRLKNQNLSSCANITSADGTLAHHVFGDFGLLDDVGHIIPLPASRLSVVMFRSPWNVFIISCFAVFVK